MATIRMFAMALIKFGRRTCSRFFCLALLALPALGVDPTYQISQYAHASWTSDAGIQAVRRIKQSPDGYLWLATRTGLVRFDGVRATTFKAGSTEGLESSTIQDLVIDPDGSMWVATLGGGLAYYQAGKFHSYTVKDGLPSDEIGALYRDSRGTLWIGTRGAGIARMAGGHFEKLPLAIPPSRINAIHEGPDHSLWIATNAYGVFRLQDGILTSYTVHDGLPDNSVTGLCLEHSGRIWTTGFRGISFWNGTRFVAHPAVNAAVSESQSVSCTEDRDGNLWIASSAGLFRAHGEEVSRMDRSTGLSGDYVSDVFEDKEGNLWAGTRSGLDRLRDGQVRLFSQSQGSIVADNQSVWTASNGQISRIAANTIRTWPLAFRAGNTPFTLLSKPDAGFLIGFNKGIRSWTSDHTRSVKEFAGLDVWSMLRSHDGSIWIGTANRGLLRWVPSAGSQRLTETGVPDRFIRTLAEDSHGAIWAGSIQGGGLYRLAGGNVQHFGREEGIRSPEIYTVFVDGKGDVWIGSAGGLSWFQDGRIVTVNSQQGLPADQVFAILDDSYDRLWITGFAGISAIDKKSLADWAAGRRQKLNPILYRSAEGLQMYGALLFFPNSARTLDGHLWFSIADGLAEVTPPDPAASHIPQFPVLVEDITVDGVPHTELARTRMSPGTRSVELRYTALTLSNPETVQFRYRLEGFDREWVDAGTRRLAFYNNLKPGAYTFRVAANTDQAHWRESSAVILVQLPFFYQTWWFALLASAGVLSLAFLTYRLRLRQAVYRIQAGFQQRIDERTRIARELHDTLLQSLHGLLLNFQRAANLLPDRPAEAKHRLEGAIDEAAKAITEGRDAVQGLRSSTVITNDLAVAIRTLGDAELAAKENPPLFNVVVEGGSRDLNPMVRDDIYRIAGEALRNAFRHAEARRIEVELHYDERRLRLRVRDDGNGVAVDIFKTKGRAGHWGLQGMRERAKVAGGNLEIWSELGSGTEIELSIPASIAYATSAEHQSRKGTAV